MESNTSRSRYRIVGIRPWSSEGSAPPPLPVETFFEGQEIDVDDLRALAASFDAAVDSVVQGGGRHQATISWRGHRYDLDLEQVD